MPHSFLIFFGAGFGGLCRYWISNVIYSFLNNRFPYGTLAVNISGSFFMGVLFVCVLEHIPTHSPQLKSLLLIGFLGGYTTFSSFSIETLTLLESGAVFKAALNICLNVFLCLLAVWIGVLLGKKI
jgi:CrcB protein